MSGTGISFGSPAYDDSSRSPKAFVRALKHLRQPIADNKQSAVGTEKIRAVGTVERFTALENNPFHKVKDLVERKSGKVVFVVIELLYDAEYTVHTGARDGARLNLMLSGFPSQAGF